MVNLGPLAAGESAVASIAAHASTTAPRRFVQVRVDGIFDGLVTSKSNQVTINHNVGPRDETPPTTSVSVTPANPNGANGWYTQRPTLNITAVDNASGFTYIERRINNGQWQAHVDGLAVPDGDNTIHARSYDAEANQSATVSRSIKVDSTAPQAAATFESSNRVVTISSSDATSGVAATEYRIGSGAWVTYNQPVVMGNASAVVSYRARDRAGNVSAVKELSVPAGSPASNKVASVTSASITPSKARYGTQVRVAVTVAAVDNSVATGSVTVREGTRVLGSSTLRGGTATITLRNPSVGRHQLAVGYAGSASVAASVQPVVLDVAKAKASVVVKAKPVKKTGRVQVNATVKSDGIVKGKKLAQVVVKRGKKTVLKKKVKVTAKGKAKVRTKKLAAGKYKVTVSFLGTATAAKAKGSKSVTVK